MPHYVSLLQNLAESNGKLFSINWPSISYCPHSRLLGNTPPTVLRFGVKVAVVTYLNFSKNAKNGINMQFHIILNVFYQKIDKLLHITVQFYTKTMDTSLSNWLNWQVY